MQQVGTYEFAGVLFDIAIFMMMAVQAKIFDHPSFTTVRFISNPLLCLH